MTLPTFYVESWVDTAAVLIIVPMGTIGELHAQEFQFSLAMHSDRKLEFSAGRIAAREALRVIGAPDVAILSGDSGEPRWPRNWVGSISHTRTHAAAMVGPSSSYRSVGIDLDDERPLGTSVAQGLMSDDEVSLILDSGIAADLDQAQRFAFSAKEAVFKCQFPLTGQADVEFNDVELNSLEIRRQAPRFVASRKAQSAPKNWPRIEVFPFKIQSLLFAVATAPVISQTGQV